MTSIKQLSQDYDRVEKALQFIKKHATSQPSLARIAASVNVSEYHFQKLFSRWVGVSPKRFLQYLTKEYAKKLLDESKNVLDVSYEIGLSGTSRLHDLFIACEAITPGEYKQRGKGIEIAYGVHPSPFGRCLLAATEKGICSLYFIQRDNTPQLVELLKKDWPCSRLRESIRHTKIWAEQAFESISSDSPEPIHLLVKGTNFQIKVWEALLRIPLGAVVTYETIARHVHMPKAARAVGNAVGKNPISFLIPCHRVIRKMGILGNYGGGKERKMAMLGWEAAQVDQGR